MKKLISNHNAERIRAKHTQEEIDNGIVTLRKGSKTEVLCLLEEKILEEVNEYFFANNGKLQEKELQDIIDVCLAIQGKSDKFSEGWILENTK